jgi:zinc protease
MSRKAMTSLTLGLASLLAIFITGIPAIVLGILAILDIRQSKGQLTGRALAVCGIVMGAILSVVYVPIWIALAIPLTQMLRANPSAHSVLAPTAPVIESEQLENGLTVILRPVQGTPNAAVLVLYSVGGDHDPAGQSGLAHLIEHIYVTAAAGTTPVRTADEFMQKYPAGWNAQTGDRYTVFATVFPKEQLEVELQQAAARMNDLRITAGDIEREKRRLIDEVNNMFGGMPQLVAYNHARERLRPTALGGRKGGLPEHVGSVTLETVQDRARQLYKPNNAVLVLAGNIEPTAARAAIEQRFGKLPAGDPAPKPHEPGAPILGSINQVSAKPLLPGATAELSVAYRAPAASEELFPAFLILAARLSSQVTKLANVPGRFPLEYSPVMDPTTLMITLPLQSGETPDQAVERVTRFVAEAVKRELTAIDRIVTKNRFVELGTSGQTPAVSGQNLYFVAFSAGRRVQLGIDSTAFAAAIDAVTAEQLRRAADAIFAPSRHVAVVARPN